jgi:hypothetical protein
MPSAARVVHYRRHAGAGGDGGIFATVTIVLWLVR